MTRLRTVGRLKNATRERSLHELLLRQRRSGTAVALRALGRVVHTVPRIIDMHERSIMYNWDTGRARRRNKFNGKRLRTHDGMLSGRDGLTIIRQAMSKHRDTASLPPNSSDAVATLVREVLAPTTGLGTSGPLVERSLFPAQCALAERNHTSRHLATNLSAGASECAGRAA